MTVASFDDLLRSAGQQTEPQRLLFVFTTADLPDDATPEQRAGLQVGEGSALTPLRCVDMSPDELPSFEALLEASRRTGPGWDIVCVAALSGSAGRRPTSTEAEAPLQRMVEPIKSGRIGRFIPFDIHGQPVSVG